MKKSKYLAHIILNIHNRRLPGREMLSCKEKFLPIEKIIHKMDIKVNFNFKFFWCPKYPSTCSHLFRRLHQLVDKLMSNAIVTADPPKNKTTPVKNSLYCYDYNIL